jgi:toluene monooxygenase electron transfer component
MKVVLQSKSGIYEYHCMPGETLLAAGLRHGITLPYECATGTCGTCRGRIIEGDAVMAWEKAPGAANLNRLKGDCLLCQTVTTTDAVVRVPSSAVQASFPKGIVPRHLIGIVQDSQLLTPDVIHFDVALEQPVDFDAGQFMTLEQPQVKGLRAYSMTQYVRGARCLSFVVKRLHGGGFSDWLFSPRIDGAALKLFGPLGRAIFEPAEDRDIICIAGGSGIAGMVAIVDRACQEQYFDNHRGWLFFGVRTLADGFYLDRLAELAERAGDNLSVTLVLSHEDPERSIHPGFPSISLDTGFVHEAVSRRMSGNYGAAIGYVAGPPPMVDGALRVLVAEGKLPPNRIRYDKFA